MNQDMKRLHYKIDKYQLQTNLHFMENLTYHIITWTAVISFGFWIQGFIIASNRILYGGFLITLVFIFLKFYFKFKHNKKLKSVYGEMK